MNFLNDDWSIRGTDIDVFFNELKNLSNKTYFKKVQMRNCLFFNLKYGQFESISNPRRLESSFSYKILKPTRCFLTTLDSGLIKQAYDNALCMNITKNKRVYKKDAENSYPVSQIAIPSILQRIKVNGLGFNKNKLARNRLIAQLFYSNDFVKVVERNDGTNKKIFAVMSEKYTPIPQSIIESIKIRLFRNAKEDGLGDGVASHWEINHKKTSLSLEFPDGKDAMEKTYGIKESITPGITIETSDTGDRALNISGYVKFNDKNDLIVYLDNSFSENHIGEIDGNTLVSCAKKYIFPEFSNVRETLSKLSKMILWDNTTDVAKRHKILKKVVNEISKETNLTKLVGKERAKKITSDIFEMYKDDVDLTVYELVVEYMNFFQQIDTKDNVLKERLSKEAIKALNMDYYNLLKEIKLVA